MSQLEPPQSSPSQPPPETPASESPTESPTGLCGRQAQLQPHWRLLRAGFESTATPRNISVAGRRPTEPSGHATIHSGSAASPARREGAPLSEVPRQLRLLVFERRRGRRRLLHFCLWHLRCRRTEPPTNRIRLGGRSEEMAGQSRTVGVWLEEVHHDRLEPRLGPAFIAGARVAVLLETQQVTNKPPQMKVGAPLPLPQRFASDELNPG